MKRSTVAIMALMVMPLLTDAAWKSALATVLVWVCLLVDYWGEETP